MKHVYTTIRFIITICFIALIFKHAHLSVGIALSILLIEMELRWFAQRKVYEDKKEKHNKWLREHGMEDLLTKERYDSIGE